jgi:hypothetical protein
VYRRLGGTRGHGKRRRLQFFQWAKTRKIEVKNDYTKDSFYEELEQVFEHIPQNNTKVLLRDFKEKLGRGDIFKPTIWDDSLHQDSNDNGVRMVKFDT